MLYLKEISWENMDAVWEYVSRVPEDENGFTNPYRSVRYEDFPEQVIDVLCAHSRGENLPEGFVPETHYLLWDGGEIAGWFRLRHHLCPSLETGGGHIGYSIREGYRGRGYATAGLKLLLPIAREKIPEDEIYLRVNRDNPASLRVMMKCGGYVHHEDEDKIYVRIRK